jgi:DNA-binding NtrC family response regulator
MLKPLDSVPDFVKTANVLCVEPDNGDRDSLNEIFERSHWPMCPDMKWELDAHSSIQAALSALRRKSIAVLMCESRPGAVTWREMLDIVSLLTDPPLLIVTSRLADERLWAEALNLGAYDVLSKPYDVSEVVRVVSIAWMTWAKRHAGTPGAETHTGIALPPAPPSRVVRGPSSRPRPQSL